MNDSPIREAKLRAQAAVRQAVKTGKIKKPTNCERCGRMVELQGHHDDYAKPLEVEWICRQCHAAEHRDPEPEWVIAARVLLERGISYKEIGELLGKTRQTIYNRVNIEKRRVYHRRTNAKRRQYKREWENAKKADPANRGRCTECGGLMGIGCPYDGICKDCQPKGMSDELKAKGHRVETLWNEGLAMQEIADQVGLTKGSLGGFMDLWRAEGFKLPYRYTKYKGAALKHEAQIRNASGAEV